MIIRLVIALNAGESINSLLKDIPKPDGECADNDSIDLRGIDFSHQNLRGPWKKQNDKLIRRGVHLQNADLSFSDLSWAFLPRANLRGAILCEANLNNSELILADLRDADLTGASFDGAWLLDTLFLGAKVDESQLKVRRNLGQMDFDYHAYEI